MKFNLLTNELFTNNNELIKKLYCPYKLNWDEMEYDDFNSKKCSICQSQIIDTKLLSDDQVKEKYLENNNTCFKIDLNQDNIEIITNGKNINYGNI